MGDFKSIAAAGDRLATLKALRDQLAGAFQEAPVGVISPLSKQLLEVLAQIDALDGESKKEGTALDEFTKKLRAKRDSDSSVGGAAGMV